MKEAQIEVLAPSALESLERAQIDMQISTAHRFPRTLSKTKERMMELATLDEETAASCFYRLSRQGKAIEGPSIRLAEIAASAFGNIRFGARVIADDGRQITAQGFCHDLESNVLSTIEVKRRVTNRDGQRYSDDMVVVTGNAACAIAARNAIFKVVPFAMVKPIFMAAKKTAVGDATTLVERRTKMLQSFAAYGVNEKRVCQAVNKRGAEDIGLEEFATLLGLYNAIKDGEQSVDEAFPEERKKIEVGDAIPKGDGATGPAGTPPVESEEPKRGRGRPKKDDAKAPEKPEPPPRATPVEGLRNIMRLNQPPIEEKDLLRYLFSEQKCEQGETLDKMPEEKIADIVAAWSVIAPKINAPEQE